MGAESSHEKPREEFMVQLSNPAELLQVCQNLGQRKINVSAINETEGLLWIQVTPELKEELDRGKCADCTTRPCVYKSKGTRFIDLPAGKTHYDLQIMQRQYDHPNEVVSSMSPPTSAEQRLYFAPKDLMRT
jgi:hypothetical protein